MTSYKTFRIAVPTDDKGFIGQACDNLQCKQYFKVYLPDLKDELYCPYCGTRYDKSSLLTSDQTKYVAEAAKEEALALVFSEIQKTFKNAFRGASHSRSGASITYKPGKPYRKRPVVPRYSEREVDTELTCAECKTRFQVYGIFGFCPGCKCENIMIYDANWGIIKRKLDGASDISRQLRYAYGDLVSTFEAFCKRKASCITTETANFQVLFDARKFFKQHAGIDILANVKPRPLLTLRRIFQKRHACIHEGGEINEKYIRMIPEDKALLGMQVVLSVAEFDEAATALRIALGDLVKKLERPGC